MGVGSFQHKIIVSGSYELSLADHLEIYAYLRRLGDELLLVVTNFSDRTPEFELAADVTYENAELILSNYEVSERGNPGSFVLKPYEARVYRLW